MIQRVLASLLCCCILTGCGPLLVNELIKAATAAEDTDATETANVTPSATPRIETSAQIALPMGGSAPGRDELVLLDDSGAPRNLTGHLLQFVASPTDIVGFVLRTNAHDFASGSGLRLIPQTVGSTVITASIDRVAQVDTYRVTVPPQALIQILIGEARGVMLSDATILDGHVALTSRSIAAEALGAVIRNRIALINTAKNPGLFAANPIAYNAAQPSAHYDAVINAQSFSIYQFSPVHPDDPSHQAFTLASARGFLPGSTQLAYDQAALTAAGIFDGTIADPTNGAFGFFTPTASQASCLSNALTNPPANIPGDCGSGDANWPALAPVQILVHPEVRLLSDGRPAFVFYRTRTTSQPAITDVP